MITTVLGGGGGGGGGGHNPYPNCHAKHYLDIFFENPHMATPNNTVLKNGNYE